MGEQQMNNPPDIPDDQGDAQSQHHKPVQFVDFNRPIETHGFPLPHWQQGEVFYFVTWRLIDSMPRSVLTQWLKEEADWEIQHPKPWSTEISIEYHRCFTSRKLRFLDAGRGSCVLRQPAVAAIVAETLLHFDQMRYHIDSFVVMPNHVHVLFQLFENARLEKVIQCWKGFSAREINKALNRTGSLWGENYWDRMIRNETHLFACRNYILNNPSKAHLIPGEFLLHG
jgi:REP element-mobilizing transposase RayT